MGRSSALERNQRSRRGKRYRAQCGWVNVLSGDPYGYRYVKKTETYAAFYEVVEKEAEVGIGGLSPIYQRRVEYW